MAENLERVNQVYYTLYTKTFGEKVIQEPKGWENDFKSYERDKDSRGIVSMTNIDLEFFGDGSDYLRSIYYGYGIEENVTLTKYERNRFSISEEFDVKYIQKLDMGTFTEVVKTGGVKVKATKGGLYDDIKNREDDEYDIIDRTSADGIDIGMLKTVSFQPKPRDIFVESLLEGYDQNFKVNSDDTVASTTYNVRTIPLNVTYNSDKEDVVSALRGDVQYNNFDHQEANNSNAIGSETHIGDTFFFQSEIDKTISLDLQVDISIKEIIRRGSNIQSILIELRKSELVNNINVLKEKTTLLTISNPLNNIGTPYSINYQAVVDLLRNESLGVVITTIKPSGNRRLKYTFDITSKLVIQDLTAYTEFITVGRAIKPLVFFDRIIAKITGKTGLVKSSIFESGGEYENILLDNGLWARGFPDVYEDGSGEEQTIQMITSFKDAFESFNYLEPLAWFIEIIGNQEYLRIEKATYTQQNFIALRLGDVDEIKTDSSLPDYFSSMVGGYSKDLDYEEINGLDEYNGKSKFSSFIKNNKSEYIFTSKYRFDSIGYELTKRKNFVNFPKEDTKRDSHIFMHDTKLVGNVYTHNLWQDRFDSEPTGIYSPSTAWNLFLSPMNRLFYGHGYSVKRGLYHFPDKEIRLASSNANKDLTTTISGFSLSEKGSIFIRDLDKPKIEATKKTFTFKMTQELQDTLDATTKVNGEYVPNVFGMVEYNEKGEKSYGRIVKLDNKEKATMLLMKVRL